VLLFTDISAVCCENTAEHRNTSCSEKMQSFLTGRVGGAYSYHFGGLLAFFSCLHENHRRGRKSVFNPPRAAYLNLMYAQRTRNKCQSMCATETLCKLSDVGA